MEGGRRKRKRTQKAVSYMKTEKEQRKQREKKTTSSWSGTLLSKV